MNDSDIVKYLLSHAPIEQFYLFNPPGTGDTLIKYFDSTGASWNLMEDNDETVAYAVAFLKISAVKSFEDYDELLEYEQEKGMQGHK